MTYKIELTEQDLQVLNMAIGEIPFKIAAPLVEKFNKPSLLHHVIGWLFYINPINQ